MSDYYAHNGKSQFTCVGQSLTGADDSNTNENCVLFYLIRVLRGALPCPPYKQDKVLSCAVCNK